MSDIRQSQFYRTYMEKIGWIAEEVNEAKVFIKKFSLFGSIIKIQRPDKNPSQRLLNQLKRKYSARSISLELNRESRVTNNGFKTNNNPYLPTKTIQLDLTIDEEEIFNRFTEAKRRAVRRAGKNGVIVKELSNIQEFIKLKSKDFWPMQYFMAKDIENLWESFKPKNATVLLACHCEERRNNPDYKEIATATSWLHNDKEREPVAGILLLFYDNKAYYWMAASTDEGKKLFAPTLLVWEALKLSKKKGFKIFDFEGIYDERFHSATKKWKGFTKFKEGFGGKIIDYPIPLIKNFYPFS